MVLDVEVSHHTSPGVITHAKMYHIRYTDIRTFRSHARITDCFMYLNLHVPCIVTPIYFCVPVMFSFQKYLLRFHLNRSPHNTHECHGSLHPLPKTIFGMWNYHLIFSASYLIFSDSTLVLLILTIPYYDPLWTVFGLVRNQSQSV